MIWQFDLIILVFLVITAIISLQVKDLLAASMIFGVYSFLMCLLWAGMAAVDVAFTKPRLEQTSVPCFSSPLFYGHPGGHQIEIARSHLRRHHWMASAVRRWGLS